MYDIQWDAPHTEANSNHVPSFLDIVKLSEVFAKSWNSLSVFSDYIFKRHLAPSFSGNSPSCGTRSGLAITSSLPHLSQSVNLEVMKSESTAGNASDIKDSTMAAPVAGHPNSEMGYIDDNIINSQSFSDSSITLPDSSSSEMCLKKARASRNFSCCRSDEDIRFIPVTFSSSQESVQLPCTSFVPSKPRGISRTMSLDTFMCEASKNSVITIPKRIASLPLIGHNQKNYMAKKSLKNKANRKVHFAPRDEVVLIPCDEEDCATLSNSSIIPLRGSDDNFDSMESVISSNQVCNTYKLL